MEFSKVLKIILDDLLTKTELTHHNSIEISNEKQHRHSSSFKLTVNCSEKTREFFIKYGAHFSGIESWEVENEFNGYKYVEQLGLCSEEYYFVKPILFNTEPSILVTEFVEGELMSDYFKRKFTYFSSAFDSQEVIEFVRKSVQWVDIYCSSSKIDVAQLSPKNISDFILMRIEEINRFSGKPMFSEKSVERFCNYIHNLTLSCFNELVPRVRAHGDYSPQNILLDSNQRICVIDIGFSNTREVSIAYEDYSNFIVYIHQMLFNPMYSNRKVKTALNAFVGQLLLMDGKYDRVFIAVIKKLLSHLAWTYHPDRSVAGYASEYRLRRWTRHMCRNIESIFGVNAEYDSEKILKELFL